MMGTAETQPGVVEERRQTLFILCPPILLEVFNVCIDYFDDKKTILLCPILFHLCLAIKSS